MLAFILVRSGSAGRGGAAREPVTFHNESAPMSDSLLLSIPEACARTGVARSFLYERLAEGSIKSVKAGRRRLVDAASLQAWAAALPTAALKQTERTVDAK